MAKKPNIRFAGFEDDWEQRKLGEMADIIGGGTPSTSEELSVTLYKALQIVRKFSGILFVYALANIVLLMLDLDYYVTCASIAILGAAFLYKLLEFLENKFCFIDAYLIMIYKTVLEKIR